MHLNQSAPNIPWDKTQNLCALMKISYYQLLTSYPLSPVKKVRWAVECSGPTMYSHNNASFTPEIWTVNFHVGEALIGVNGYHPLIEMFDFFLL